MGSSVSRLLRGPAVLYLPAALFLLVFFLVPLFNVAWMSFTEPDTGVGNYIAFFSSSFDVGVLLNTFKTAAIVTLTSLIFAYPVAYVAARYGGAFGSFLLIVVTLSFWTSFLVRTYAWMVILGVKGPITAALVMLGWSPPPQILFTTFASTFAMTHLLMPFMILTLYAVMRRIDATYMRAAAGLGAKPLKAFTSIYLPLSLPGIANGSVLVFITCLGFYVTPVLLGSPRDKMIAGRIGDEIEQMLNFGGASAMAMVLLVATLGLFALYSRFFGLDKLWK
ncbi:ABC transporter permease [Chelatococcus asaccharovorans]|uniref:ABC-type spermidine/putrescine transport system permease subunit I n=1 Tax=Chelatococcus asaccharovorans TaxID=28210 RepID=A0A2V3U8X6_9HYPH|nr:ABC transporter permease [Chelatococcus asaccharovorans]MBS7705331.1 ABC transporter permease [Chelatococcus asaccharovorans]PXW60266.1 ABC-type spermidine/putrescine transport system permease subunit I [Chelatococcus asaccharovorans]CAH1654814.1 ABC-type spermidine/putrescine transport system permease subunit I [Chelatococcus asaccharovorans]CAH1685633.1 ABC-type spermidine/putrescine transport system permease subunit I [Chelatococcus asaccharovorans]